jgi:hypothetical protein
MKQGYTAVGVLVIVGVVLALGALFVLSESNTPTGYAGSGVPLTGAVSFAPQDTPCSSDDECTPPDTCQYYPGYGGYYCGNGCSDSCTTAADCPSDFGEECCGDEDSIGCSFGSCVCISPCDEGEFCETDAESGSVECGGIKGGTPASKPCLPTEPDGESNGGCDCDMDGCTEGAFCSTFGGILSHPYDNPCGENGHCVITGTDDGGMPIGQCACGEKPCELLDAEGFEGEFDQCEDTVQCDEGSVCSNHDDCGGVGLGRCEDGICDCECASWAPCDPNDNFGFDFNTACGAYGEGGVYGRCIVGADGAAECMCTDDLGCSPLDCIPGETPCTGHPLDCGGDGEDNCVDGICEACGTTDCDLPCISSTCDETPLTQEDCDEAAEEIGSVLGCTVDTGENACDCDGIPDEMCSACYSTTGGLIGNCE